MFAYAGEILRIDLTEQSSRVQSLSNEMIEEYLGGNGFAVRLLYDEVEQGTDPFSPENKLIFATGPLTGIVPMAGKICAVSKSPLTNVFADSYSGGWFGPMLKFAGFDVLVVEGRAHHPMYVNIDDDQVTFRDARSLWGIDTYDAEDVIRDELGARNVSVATIGPAGENLVRYAVITNEYGRQFGRCGLGAVMGSKKLKAIAVQGSGSLSVRDPRGTLDLIDEWCTKFKESAASKSYFKYGSADNIEVNSQMGLLPTKYWSSGSFDEIMSLRPKVWKPKYVSKSKGCYGCIQPCGKLFKIDEGKFAGTIVEGPEYETIYSMGSLCLNGDIEAIARQNELCDRLGLDTITTGNCIAFAMQCYENSILTKKDTDGLEMNFGNADAQIEMIQKIVRREGIGDILAEGTRLASQTIGKGAEALAVHVKGLEPPGFDPRRLKAMGVAYSVSSRGACHLRSCIYSPDRAGDFDAYPLSHRGRFLKKYENLMTILDTLIMCKFQRSISTIPDYTKALRVVTGKSFDEEELLTVAERINNLERLFNIREGITRKDDRLPAYVSEVALKFGSSKGTTLKKEELEGMLDEYYRARGWNKQGIPRAETLENLGLQTKGG